LPGEVTADPGRRTRIVKWKRGAPYAKTARPSSAAEKRPEDRACREGESTFANGKGSRSRTFENAARGKEPL